MKKSLILKIQPLAVAITLIIAATPTLANDLDHDGLSDDYERQIGTDSSNPDSDGGGVLDGWEIERGFNPLDSSDDADIPLDLDIDNDGVLNHHEGDNLNDADSDGDGMSDAFEIGLIDADNDGFLDDLSDANQNGMPDVAEALAISDLYPYPDFDGDGLPNHLDADSDNDGVHDILEYDTSWVPENYVGNPLDVDGDGQLNAMDYDSDNDGILDFDEQNVGTTFSPANWVGIYYYPNKTDQGQVFELADEDGDGIPNQADAYRGPDTDNDGIADQADIDHAVHSDKDYEAIYGVALEHPTTDADGDGIEDDYDWDSNSDGALDFTATAALLDTGDNDGIPAMFDADDQTAYTAGQTQAPDVGAATLGESGGSSGGGAFGFWTLLALCFARVRHSQRGATTPPRS